jgi:hypothetical protein
MTLVQTAPLTTYIKTGRQPVRTSGKEKVAKTNTKINEFFAPAGDGRPSSVSAK